MNKDEKKMIEAMAEVINRASDECFYTICTECMYYRSNDFSSCKGISEAKALYNANCRIIADDEIVIKKRQYEQLKKYNRDRKRLRLKWQIAEQEKRQILQVLKDNIVNRIGSKYAAIDLTDIAQRAKELGIELEDKNNDDK